MNVKEYEDKFVLEVKHVVETIIKNNIELTISARSRAGAEISDFLEEKFVNETKGHKTINSAISAPRGQTKNPWDVKFNYTYKKHSEEIWVDLKAIKVTSKDSNPDIGTPNKVINFIKEGGFYLLYVFVYYEATNQGLRFVKNKKNDLSNIYLLKNINHTFRRNPKNQLQVNISELPEYRTREAFIKLLIEKIDGSHRRQIEISKRALKTLSKQKEELLKTNKLSEEKIKNL